MANLAQKMLDEVWLYRRPWRAAGILAQAIRNKDFSGWAVVRGVGPFKNRVYVRTPDTKNLVRVGTVVRKDTPHG